LTFENPLKGVKQHYTGTLLCNGAKYRLLTDNLDVYCDGQSKWLCSTETNEVVIQYVSPSEETTDITDNPLKFLTAYQKNYTCASLDDRTENGTTLAVIAFTPINKKAAAYSSILLTMEKETANPYAIQYSAKNGDYTIRITRITPNVETFDGYFAFPKHKYPGVEIIDLR
jgi:outer membrane lipoprotein-sorting protein